jgi:CRP/FNR family transcriptional regulator, transcriptional activator FtrB
MRAQDHDGIQKLPLFNNMKPGNFEELMHAAYFQKFPPQVQLINQGEKADFLHIVTEGCVELFATSNGRETIMQLIRPISTFFLAAVVKDAVHLQSARTVEKSKILLVPAENIRNLMASDEAFARTIIVELASCYRSVVKAHKNQKLRTSVERLANYLIHLHADQGSNKTATLPYDKRMIASLLGMTPENLSRAFGTLAAYGVEVNGATITYATPDDLEVLAKPTQLIDDPDL